MIVFGSRLRAVSNTPEELMLSREILGKTCLGKLYKPLGDLIACEVTRYLVVKSSGRMQRSLLAGG